MLKKNDPGLSTLLPELPVYLPPVAGSIFESHTPLAYIAVIRDFA